MFKRTATLIVAVAVVLMSVCASQAGAEERYYGIEMNGVLCGYARVETSTLEDGSDLILLKHELFVMLSALGSEFNSEVMLTYHIDPVTGNFTYHDSEVDQGQMHIDSKMYIEDGVARCTSSLSKGETVVEIPPGAVLENTLYFYHLKRDFVDGGLNEKSYESFEVREEEMQTVVYTKVGMEKIELAGRDVVVLERFNEATAIKYKIWIEAGTGMTLKTEMPNNRRSYLADESVKKKIQLADLDDTIVSKVGVSIADVPGITYMKVQATVEPTGLRVTPDDLNVPGQTFTGTVDENIVKGVFEIEHPHYDGENAPPFPPDYSDDESLRQYLEPSDLIQSDDPVLIEKAQSLTAGSKDSWEAACRLSEWVADNISYAIPGGGSARNTFDIRAGECGAHSMLVAAFCRGVGIPARVIWGCMYIPNYGGAFGQHGWNEIYMGEAGWVPVDATAAETDFVDSGHIRIGVYESMSTALNPREMELLDYRIGSGSEVDLAEAGQKYEKYVGEYRHPEVGDPFTVLVQDGGLAVDIPNRMVLGFSDPDDDGCWYCKLSRNLFCTFEEDEAGTVTTFSLHELIPVQRESAPEKIADDVPEDLRAYLGVFPLAQLNAVFTVVYHEGGLAVHNSLEDRTVKLNPPDEKGGWLDEFGKNTIYFDKDEDGNVTSLTIDSVSKFER